MEFMQSAPDIVRSDHQRRLLGRWASLRDGKSLPIWRQLDPGNIPLPFDDLVLIEVVGDTDNARFRIAIQGSRLAEGFGWSECVGKFVDEVLPPAYRNSALSTYRQVVSSKLPVYTASDMREPAGRIVQQENHFLSFRRVGVASERVMDFCKTSSTGI